MPLSVATFGTGKHAGIDAAPRAASAKSEERKERSAVKTYCVGLRCLLPGRILPAIRQERSALIARDEEGVIHK
jgi:hypothetical protein